MTGRADSRFPPNLASASLKSNPDAVRQYAELTADYNPIHLDAAFAARTPFGSPIIHGTMGLNLLVQAIEETFGGVIPAAEIDVRFVKPVPVGTAIHAVGKLADHAAARYEVCIETDAGTRAIEGTLTLSPGNK